MPVNIYNPSPTGGGVRIPLGSQLPNRFQDLFTRANAPNLGPAWLQAYYTSNTSNSQINASIGGNLATFIGSINSTNAGLIAPLPLAWMSQVVRNQFSEITIGTIGGSILGFGFGPACVFSPQMAANSTNNGFYFIQWNNTNLQIFRYVYNGLFSSGAAATSLLTIATTVITGDVLRLEATNSGGTWTLTAKKNGTVIGTITDSTLIQGMPAMYMAVANGAAPTPITISEFAGGTL
jgi:hypothetical protein